MSRTSTLIFLGILVILAPFSGLPVSIRALLEVIFGACVFGIGLSMRAAQARNTTSAQSPVEVPQPPSISPI